MNASIHVQQYVQTPLDTFGVHLDVVHVPLMPHLLELVP